MKLVPLSDRVVLKQCEAEETQNQVSSLQAVHRKHHRRQRLSQLVLAEWLMEKKLPCR